jgi:regulator of replication initiation timing
MATTTTTTKAAPTAPALEPIDRLEEKIKLLVSVIGRLRGEQTRVVEENARLQREVEALRGRLTEAEAAAGELGTLRSERDQIRSRVSEMLQQLDALNL